MARSRPGSAKPVATAPVTLAPVVLPDLVPADRDVFGAAEPLEALVFEMSTCPVSSTPTPSCSTVGSPGVAWTAPGCGGGGW